ncbi:hypothetical protein Hte_002370 [Hypoxylon texense]
MLPSSNDERVQELVQLLCLGGFHIFAAATYLAWTIPNDLLPTPPPSLSSSSLSSSSLSSSIPDAGPNTTTTTTTTTTVTPQIGSALRGILLAALEAFRFWPLAVSWCWLTWELARGRWAPAKSMPRLGGFLTAVMAWVLLLLRHLVSSGGSASGVVVAANLKASTDAVPWSAMTTMVVGCGLLAYWVGYALEWRSGYWFQFAEVMVWLSEKSKNEKKKKEEEAYRLPTREVPVYRDDIKVMVKNI